MDQGPALPDPGRDEDPTRHADEPGDPLYDGSGEWRLLLSGADWMDEGQWAAYQASLADEDEPDDPDLYEDPDSAPPPGLDDARLAELIAGAREITAAEAAAAGFASGSDLSLA
jgi:hypothetical protein